MRHNFSMLIEPPSQPPSTVTRKRPDRPVVVHWVLMAVLWLSLFINVKLLKDVEYGRLVMPKDHSGFIASVVFVLCAFFIVYTVGMTLLLAADLALNRSGRKKYYQFFVPMNSLMITAFVVLWVFVLITF